MKRCWVYQGEINSERKAILYENKVPEKFPKNVSLEAEQINKNVSDSNDTKRKDLRKKLVFTIDGDDAKDFDDAVCVENTKVRL